MQKLPNLVSVLVCLIACLAFYACGGNDSDSEADLISVVVISRHGIRSPISPLDQYTQRSQGFPRWPAPADVAGNLSTVGQQNVARLGAWYRDFYSAQGLLLARGSCPSDDTVFVYADVFERTISTARGYLQGLFQGDPTPDCGVPVIHSDLPLDPYIATAYTGVCKIDSAVDLTAFNAAIGGSPDSLVRAYASELQKLQSVTQCCQPEACGNPSSTSCSLLELPNEVSVNPITGAIGFGAKSLFTVADALTETFELEYAQGMSVGDCAATQGAECVGWGAITPKDLYDLTKLHAMNINLYTGLPSVAQVGSTNLMWQLTGTMEQALSGVKSPDILAPVKSRFTMFVAHDENLSAIGAFLGGVEWKAEGFQQNDPGPAGALVFELHQIRESGALVVRLFYVIASLDQMRNGTTLTLQSPPQRIHLEIPACGSRDCPYEQFKAFIADHIRKDCLVTPDSLG